LMRFGSTLVSAAPVRHQCNAALYGLRTANSKIACFLEYRRGDLNPHDLAVTGF